MKSKLSIALIILIVLGVIGVGSIWSHRNTMVDLEERLNAQYTSNKSAYDNMWKKFKESAQVTDMQAEKMKEVYTGLIEGRYKDNNLLFKMVKEDNPKLDQSTFVNLQNEISSSRNAFNNKQEQISDIVREYNTYVRKHPITTLICNYKVKDAKDFIITSERTQKAFDSKKDDEIKLK